MTPKHTAFVLVTVTLGHEQELLHEIKIMEKFKDSAKVKNYLFTFATYDVVLELAGTSAESIRNLRDNIRKIAFVRSTTTLTVLNSWRSKP